MKAMNQSHNIKNMELDPFNPNTDKLRHKAREYPPRGDVCLVMEVSWWRIVMAAKLIMNVLVRRQETCSFVYVVLQ